MCFFFNLINTVRNVKLIGFAFTYLFLSVVIETVYSVPKTPTIMRAIVIN